MNNELPEKQCKDCVHFVPYYAKYKYQFWPVSKGHCVNKKPSGHSRKTDKICECFTEIDSDNEKEKQLNSIAEQFKLATGHLRFVAERLNELVHLISILKSEKKTE